MITHKELCKWSREIESALTAARAEMKNNRLPQLRNYYEHIATCADAQLCIVNRLIRQSAANEVIQTHANNKSA